MPTWNNLYHFQPKISAVLLSILFEITIKIGNIFHPLTLQFVDLLTNNCHTPIVSLSLLYRGDCDMAAYYR